MKGRKTGGRQKGTPNKITAILKDAILQAADNAGGKDGLVGYLETQARENPGPFLALLGKVLPLQMKTDGPLANIQPNIILRTIVDPNSPNPHKREPGEVHILRDPQTNGTTPY